MNAMRHRYALTPQFTSCSGTTPGLSFAAIGPSWEIGQGCCGVAELLLIGQSDASPPSSASDGLCLLALLFLLEMHCDANETS